MTMRSILTLFCLLAIPACATAPANSNQPSATFEETSVPSNETTTTPSLALSSVQPSRAPLGADDELTGILGADSIEGGCGYLQAVNGTRYEVVYPDGWRLQMSPLQLSSPEGEVVARGGDEVTVRGTETNELASICQIGPIFRATDVER
jgi:hypothetical protein